MKFRISYTCDRLFNCEQAYLFDGNNNYNLAARSWLNFCLTVSVFNNFVNRSCSCLCRSCKAITPPTVYLSYNLSEGKLESQMKKLPSDATSDG